MKPGSIIKEVRKKKNISQGELANKLNISQTYLSQIESDKKIPSMDLLQNLSIKLDIPVFYFLFKGLEVDKDISPDKREAYRKLSPAISSMIEGFFIS